MGMFSFLNIFAKKETRQQLDNGMNVNVVRGFLEQIEDTICIANSQGDIEYINNISMKEKYKTLRELFEYQENKSLYNKIIATAMDEGAFIGDIELNKNQAKIGMYVAIYYTETAGKFVIYIKDMNKYLEHEMALREELTRQKEFLKSKDILIANLSHEVRTPINIIVGMIYFLKNTSLDETQMSYINKLENSSNSLLDIVNNMLDVSKKNINNVSQYEKTNFNLKEFFQNLTDAFDEKIKEKNLKWYFNPNFDVDINVYTDKIRLNQVFINLVNNAIKYTDKGYIELEANKISENNTSYQLQFCLKDTGIGIRREDTIKIFKEFEQVENPTTKLQQGTGMGLAIAKKIVENMKGKIWVESNYRIRNKILFHDNN